MPSRPEQSTARDREFDIAVIGLASHLPGARSAAQFWRNLEQGVESIVAHSREELVLAGVPAKLIDHPGAVWASSNIADIDLFDASFFGYSPAEAEIIDPQQRLFLECAWEALEDAAYDPANYAGLIGVFAGCGFNSYLMRLLERGGVPATEGLHLTIGNDKDYLATRVSYKLNLTGPSVTVQTACSSSLAAVHLACQSLLALDCDIALAGGVSIRSPQPLAYLAQEGSILSTDGHCRAFDARATGTVFGNGLGIAVLKRCQEAVDDGDHIYAVIRGSSLNNDGSSKAGYSAPSVDGQAAVIRRALAAAGVDASALSYIEAHGTGTRLGDPIEIAALKQVFSEVPNHPGCALGTVKTNVGHLDTAAGITGFLKLALALAHEVIPPSLHFEQPNPEMHISDTPFHIVTRSIPWKRGARPRLAGVSSFGIGGTNVHVVLEEAPTFEVGATARRSQVFTLSARSETALTAACANLANYLAAGQPVDLADVAYTLHVGRAVFSHRRSFVSSTCAEAIEALQKGHSPATSCDPSLSPSVVFMFPGQGSQHVDMGLDLYLQEALFHRIAAQSAEAFRPLIGIDLRELRDPTLINQTRYAQPALFMIEYALARLWMSWGVQPAAMLGHSVGEIVAACLAGVFSFEDAVAVVAARALAMQNCPPGAMLALNLSQDELSALPSGISVAARNAPNMTVLSGSSDAIAAFEQAVVRRGTPCRRLKTSHAFHSHLMDGALQPFLHALERVRFSPPRLRFLSCLSGQWIQPQQATDPAYWVAQLRNTVHFGDGVQAAAALRRPVLLEVGPMQTLSKVARAHHVDAIASLSEPDQGKPDDTAVLHALGELWNRGVRVDWTEFHKAEHRRRTSLPSYPFERRRYWYDESRPVALNAMPTPGPIFLPSWRLALPASALPPRPTTGQGGWLFFLDDLGLGEQLVDSLPTSGARVATVVQGEYFERISENAFRMPPSDRGAYERLLRELRDGGYSPPHTVVDLWSVTPPPPERDNSDAVLAAGFDHLLLLVSEAAAISWTPDLFSITNRTWQLSTNDPLEPVKAAATGILRVAPLEQPGLECRQIDVETYEPGNVPGALVDALRNELGRLSPDTVVALRGANRWVQSLDPVSLAQLDAPGPAAFPERGVYLITGGFGELGLEVAEWLAQHRKARIALLGRHEQPLPARLREAEVLLIEGDVSSPQQVSAALDLVQARFGVIDVVFHLAGVPGAGFLQAKTLAAAHAVLTPKLAGSLTLARALRQRGGGTLVLFSSTFSIAGGLGQADYCAANACLDAVAHLENAGTLRVLSVNWDGWRTGTWQRELASLLPEAHAALERQRADSGLTIDEAMPALEMLLAAGLPQALFSKQDFPALLARSCSTAHSLLERLAAVRSAAPCPAPAERPYLHPRTSTEARVAGIWSAVLGIPRVGASDEFLALGGHSLFAIQVAARCRDEFQVDLGMREMLECQTVSDLAAVIDRKETNSTIDDLANLIEEIASLSEEDVREELRRASGS